MIDKYLQRLYNDMQLAEANFLKCDWDGKGEHL